MRISKSLRDTVRAQGLAGLYKVMEDELVIRIESLKKASDIRLVSKHQAAIELLEDLLKFKACI